MASRSLGSLTLDLIAKTGMFEQGMDRAARSADKRMKEIERRAKVFGAAVGAAVVAGLGTAVNQLRSAINGMDELSKAAQRVSLPTEQFSALVYAGKLADVEIGTLQTSLGRLTKAQADALKTTSEQSRMFRALGIDVTDAAGKLRSSHDVLLDFADAFKRQQGSPEIVAAGIKVFGRNFQELIPLIKDGSQGLREAADEAQAFGQIISTETGQAAEAFNDNLSRLGMLASGLANAVAAELLPDLRRLTDEMVDGAREGANLTKVAKDIADAIRGLVSWMQGASQVGASFRASIEGWTVQLAASRDIVASIFTLDWSRLQNSFGEWREAGRKAWGAALFGVEEAKAGAPALQIIEASDLKAAEDQRIAEMRRAAAEAERLRKLAFGDQPRASATGGRGGKSDAQREAEQLQRSYDSLMETMRERIDLMGVESEVSKMLYRVTNGDLKALDDTRRQALVTLAEEFDAKEMLRKQLEKEEELRKKEAQRIEDGMKAGSDLVSDLEFELRLMKMGNAERAAAIQLRGMEAEAVKKYGDQVVQLNRDIEESMKQIQLMDGIRGEFATFFEDVIGGTKSIKDAFTDMLDNINRMILQRITENWVEQLFGGFGTNQTGSAGGWLSTLASWFGGGRASGGHVGPNRMYEVNESGMEMLTVRGRDYLLTGNNSGNITPAHQIGGGRSMNVTQQFINPVLADRRSDTQRAADSARKLRQAQRYA